MPVSPIVIYNPEDPSNTENEAHETAFYVVGSFYLLLGLAFTNLKAPATSFWIMVRQTQTLFFMGLLTYGVSPTSQGLLKALGEIFNINFIKNLNVSVTDQRPDSAKFISQDINTTSFINNGLVRVFYLVGAFVLFKVFLGQKRALVDSSSGGARISTTPVFKLYHMFCCLFFRMHELVLFQIMFATSLQFNNPGGEDSTNVISFILALFTFLYFIVYLYFTFTRNRNAPTKDEPEFVDRDIDYHTSFIGDKNYENAGARIYEHLIYLLKWIWIGVLVADSQLKDSENQFYGTLVIQILIVLTTVIIRPYK